MSSMTLSLRCILLLTHRIVDPRKRPEPYPATMVCRPFLLAKIMVLSWDTKWLLFLRALPSYMSARCEL